MCNVCVCNVYNACVCNVCVFLYAHPHVSEPVLYLSYTLHRTCSSPSQIADWRSTSTGSEKGQIAIKQAIKQAGSRSHYQRPIFHAF